jgi:hypothetical protein
MKNIPFFPIAFLMLFLVSCKKDSIKPEISHLYFGEHALDYIQVNSNKYFIYKDSATGDLDSVLVTESSLDTNYVSAVPAGPGWSLGSSAYYFQSYTLKLTGYNSTRHIIADWFYGNASSNTAISYCNCNAVTVGTVGFPFPTDSSNVYFSENNPHTTVNLGIAFSYPFALENGLEIPAITIEKNEYNDVVEFISDDSNSHPPPDSQYFSVLNIWAKGVGIIKRSITNATSTQTWTLVKTGER